MSGAGERLGGFFGRRKGKRLRPGQGSLLETLLPRLRLPDTGGLAVPGLFPGPVSALCLEIGFGGGEHLAHRARTEPETGFIGCEPFRNGMAKLLAVIDAEGISNIRLWDRDALELLPRLPAGSLDRVVLLYPDPWPKRRQRKRRFVSDATLAALAAAVKPGGKLLFATDIDDYAGWTLARILRSPHWEWTADSPAGWTTPFEGWPGTRYEAKAIREGRAPAYLTMLRRPENRTKGL